MTVDVVLLPGDLRPEHRRDRTIPVFDVLRATTSMAAALAAGVKEIRVFADLDSSVAAAHASTFPHLLVGERHAVKPPGFDLGNSPGAFRQDLHEGVTLFMSTTNGTRAIVSAAGARTILIGALVNASAVASAIVNLGADVTLLCSGTEGEISLEDLLGAGAVIGALQAHGPVDLASDLGSIALRLFDGARGNLIDALRSTRGGRNVIRAGLDPDIRFAAELDSLAVVGVVSGDPPRVTRWK